MKVRLTTKAKQDLAQVAEFTFLAVATVIGVSLMLIAGTAFVIILLGILLYAASEGQYWLRDLGHMVVNTSIFIASITTVYLVTKWFSDAFEVVK